MKLLYFATRYCGEEPAPKGGPRYFAMFEFGEGGLDGWAQEFSELCRASNEEDKINIPLTRPHDDIVLMRHMEAEDYELIVQADEQYGDDENVSNLIPFPFQRIGG